MRNLTSIERRFIWRTKSPRMRISLILWIVGLRRIATLVAKTAPNDVLRNLSGNSPW